MRSNTINEQQPKISRWLPLGALILLLLGALTGCNSVEKVAAQVIPFYSYDKTELTRISLMADVDSNSNMPVAIDLVFIYDELLNSALAGFSGPEWFHNKASITLRYQQDIKVHHIEVAPLTMIEALTLPEGFDDAVEVMMFANYIDKAGQYAVDITMFNELQITLKHSGYLLKELNP
jgi:type VI secretion system protein